MRKTIQEDYYLFPERPVPTDALKPSPSRVVFLAALELAVQDARGYHMLITCPRYEASEEQDPYPETGQWTPPHVSCTVLADGYHLETVGDLLEAIEDGETNWNPEAALVAMLAQWSCGITKVDPLGSFIEYKRSWSSPDKRNVYKVFRFSAQTARCKPQGLADAECRKGFFYLPIDDPRYGRATRKRFCPTHARDEVMFLDKPLATNLVRVVADADARHSMCATAVDLRELDHPRLNHFHSSYEGLLVCADIAGYGAAHAYIRDRMLSLDLGANAQAEILGQTAAGAFAEICMEAGTRQVASAGDGFVAGVPSAGGESDVIELLVRFLDPYKRFMEAIEQLNQLIFKHFTHNGGAAADAPIMGSRLALHWGSYRYGKMALLSSSAASFDGEAVIEVVRLEQGLSRLTKDPAASGGSLLYGLAHTVIASDELVAKTTLEKADATLKPLGRALAKSKEYEMEASTLAWDLPAA